METSRTLAHRIRYRVLELGLAAGKNGSHQGSGLSTVDLLAVLYGSFLGVTKNNLNDPSRNRLILSKGHAAVALYATLEAVGFIPAEETATFESNGTRYYAHAHRDLSRGIEFSGGSLSLGFSYAVGVAIACRRVLLNNHIYVIVGDGECDEGLIWEAAMAASNFNLSNLTVIIDSNGMQSDGCKREIMNSGSLCEKFESFGFASVEIDGHSHCEITGALSTPSTERPRAIIARTIKGKGVSFMESNPDWHYGVLTPKLFELALRELDGEHHV